MFFDSSMEITKLSGVTVKDLLIGYRQEAELKPNEGLYAYNNKLCIRPEFQRSFVYSKKQSDAVVESILRGYPLNNMYWFGDTDFNCGDGQQRTISICNFGIGVESVKIKDFNHDQPFYIHDLKNKYLKLYDRFMNYPLEIYICSHGTEAEISAWFEAINTHGEQLTPQELRNANFTGKWLTSAKKYFSKSNIRGAATPAERDGAEYIPNSVRSERQEYLELAIQWIINSNKDTDIWAYMQSHYKEENADELINHYKAVIDWVKDLFPTMEKKYCKQKFWGEFYTTYANNGKDYDPTDMMETFDMLIANKDELVGITQKNIINYCFTRDEKLLNPRTFSDSQRKAMYKRQNGKCACCGEVFNIEELDADHIIPWDEGGKTDTDNGQMLCKRCHIKRHNTTIRFNNF